MPNVELQELLAKAVAGPFYKVDLNQVRETVEALSWIRHAAVARQWPHTLVVSVSEHQPIAAWGDDQMISERGEVFAHHGHYSGGRLTKLFADSDRADDVLAQYLMLSDQLARHNIEVTQLYLEPSGAYKALLDNRIELQIGHKDVAKRIKTLDRALNWGLNGKIDQINRLDLRHQDSLAVEWKVQLEQKVATN